MRGLVEKGPRRLLVNEEKEGNGVGKGATFTQRPFVEVALQTLDDDIPGRN
jgi:hypothetical protein